MKGLAKGYRLFKEGIDDCEGFALEVPESVSGLLYDAVDIPVTKKTGHPDFPVRVEATQKNCVPGQRCRSSYGAAFNQEELDNLKLVYHCFKEDVDRSPIVMRVVGKDIDNVKSEPIDVAISCIKPVES